MGTLEKLYLGVDGGGTRCRVRLADENLETISEAVGGPSNLQLESGNAAYRSIRAVTEEVFSKAGLDIDEAARTYACFGMAGAHMQSARDEFAVREFPFAKVRVLNDVETARAGAHAGEDGAVLIAGTGSSGLALVKGKLYPVGGWGFHVSDTASGAILGRAIVRRSLEAHEGLSEPSALSRAVIEKLGGDCNSVMAWSFKAWPTDWADVVPMFFEYYEKGDPIAREMMEFELAQIDQFVKWFTDRGVKRLAVVGGLGKRLHQTLAGRYGELIVEPLADALHGALILAKQAFP